MPRRKKERGIEVLLSAPWWVSVSLGLFTWVILSTIIPSVFASNPFLAGVVAVSKAVAWLPLLFFGFIAIVSYFKSRQILWSSTTLPHKPLFSSADTPQRKPIVRLEKDIYQELAQAVTPVVASTPDWDAESLRLLEWKRFELLCAKYYEAVGFKTATLSAGADGGIDIKLYKANPDVPIAIVQCKAWSSPVSVKEIRELFGVMNHEKVQRGIFITSGSYTKDALAFGAANPIQLLDGETFLKKICDLAPEMRDALKEFAFAGDYITPTCASCGVKMVRREGEKRSFWGCMNFPRCRTTLTIKSGG